MSSTNHPKLTSENAEIHYCWVCKVQEKCKQEQCDFRKYFQAHGYCMAKVEELLKNANQ